MKGLIDWMFLSICAAGLCLVFLTQHIDWLSLLLGYSLQDKTHFIFNKSLRLIMNDVFMLGLIAIWFKEKQITRFAVLIQLFDLVVLFPVYVAIKLHIEGATEISSPLLSLFHRLIVNPTLMILFIVGIYIQRLTNNK